MTTFNELYKLNSKTIKVLDHGFVLLTDFMGSDHDIAQTARTSYGKGTKQTSDDVALIRYLFRKQHTSPIEMAELKFMIKMPIFVARQHVRHRTASINEYSARYSIMTDEFYMPEHDRFQGQHQTNKQASGDTLEYDTIEELEDSVIDSYQTTYENYQYTLKKGLSRELARIQLPVGQYTEMYWKIDLKNFLHYVKLRTDKKHAQMEIVAYAEAMYNLVKPLFPIACQAFEDYWLNARTFSAIELELLGECLMKHLDVNLIECNKMGKNELADFRRTLEELI